jgi:magnesium transporter
LYDAWPALTGAERIEGFEYLQREDAESFFHQLNLRDRSNLVLGLPTGERRLWMRSLAADDAADVIQEVPPKERAEVLACSTKLRSESPDPD